MPLITTELATFLHGPNSIIVATQDGRLVPECLHALALRCEAGDGLTLWLPAGAAKKTVANLAVTQRLAVAVELPSAHKTVQLKGVATRVGPAPETSRPYVEQSFEAYTIQCMTIGLARRLMDQIVRWPAVEIAVRVSEAFDQTPGPGAGGPLRVMA